MTLKDKYAALIATTEKDQLRYLYKLSEVTLLSKFDDNWNLIRTEDRVEGYCSANYLTAI